MSLTVVLNHGSVSVPEHARESLAAFREWAGDNDLPEKTRVDFYKGEVWVDMSQEQIFTHGLVKTAIASVLFALATQTRLGNYWCNGILVTNPKADLSGNPDGTFISHDAFSTKRVTLTAGAESGYVEVVGTVDMVLEVVSPSSAKKDEETLREAYWEAGIHEYWLVDARGEGVVFHILKHGPKGYTTTRPQPGGWVKSVVFGKSFRLMRGLNEFGDPTFTLEVK
jgi:Uma2 family endonuclease